MFIEALDAGICEQMIELSIGAHLPVPVIESDPYDDYSNKRPFDGTATKMNAELIFLVTRFRKLKKLYLIVRGVDCFDTRFIFENCTDLIEFGFWCWGRSETDEMFKHIKRNCQHIKTIRLFGVGIFHKHLQKLRQMFPDVSIDVAIHNNMAFPITADNPRHNEMILHIPDN